MPKKQHKLPPLRVLASCSCRICGDPYNLIALDDKATLAEAKGHDDGLCSVCHVGDNPAFQGTAGTQVRNDLAALNWFASGAGESWDMSAFMWWQHDMEWHREYERAKYDQVRSKRDTERRVETRICPVCWDDFEVEMPKHGGHNKVHCCDRCQNTAKVRRQRTRASSYQPK